MTVKRDEARSTGHSRQLQIWLGHAVSEIGTRRVRTLFLSENENFFAWDARRKPRHEDLLNLPPSC